MVNFKDWNVKMLGHVLLLIFVLVIIVAIMVLFINPLLIHVFPQVFTAISLTDTLLLLILVRLFIK